MKRHIWTLKAFGQMKTNLWQHVKTYKTLNFSLMFILQWHSIFSFLKLFCVSSMAHRFWYSNSSQLAYWYPIFPYNVPPSPSDPDETSHLVHHYSHQDHLETVEGDQKRNVSWYSYRIQVGGRTWEAFSPFLHSSQLFNYQGSCVQHQQMQSKHPFLHLTLNQYNPHH